MFPDHMYPEIYFWGSAFFLLLAFEISSERKRKTDKDLFDHVVYGFLELMNLVGSILLLHLGSL